MSNTSPYTSAPWISAAAAAAIVALGGWTFEHGHDAPLPTGVVELGQFEAGDPMQLAAATLPELVITAAAVAPSPARLAGRGRAPLLDGDALAPIAVSTVGVLLN